MHIVLRLEWVHAQAANERWREELHLLSEELRRIQVTFTKEAIKRGDRWPEEEFAKFCYGLRPQRGYQAYSIKQSNAYIRLAEDALRTRRKLNLTKELDLDAAIRAMVDAPPSSLDLVPGTTNVTSSSVTAA